MAIDPLTEHVVSLAEAAELYSRNSRGKKPDVSVLYRHTTRGLRGVRLESIQCGSKRCTSRQAVARFFSRLTELAENGTSSAIGTGRPAPATDVYSTRNDTEVKKKLDQFLGPKDRAPAIRSHDKH